MYKPLHRSPWYIAHHIQDSRKNLGFDYHGHVLEKTMSKPIFANRKNKAMLQKVEVMVNYLIDTVKQIKLQYLISMDKNDINLN
jgi:hypothetical protein